MIIKHARLGETPFAVIDLETTGFNAERTDRVIEIAVVKLTPEGELHEEYVSLVNPKRDVGPTDVHGITAADVLHSPTFEEIGGDVGARLADSILVGHNLSFDLRFLTAEFARAGVSFPTFPTLCTLRLGAKLVPETPSRKLTHCCAEAGVSHEHEHSALGDARATAALFAYYLELARKQGSCDLSELGCTCTNLPASDWLTLNPLGRAYARQAAAIRRAEETSYLARLIESMLGDETPSPQAASYLEILDRMFEDRRITRDEAEHLVGMASSLGLSRSDVLAAHRAYLSSLVSEALNDGIVTDMERRDLAAVCDMLDLNHAALDELLVQPIRPVLPHSNISKASLSGKKSASPVSCLVRLTGKISAEKPQNNWQRTRDWKCYRMSQKNSIYSWWPIRILNRGKHEKPANTVLGLWPSNFSGMRSMFA